MRKTIQINLSDGKITGANVFSDGTCELTIEFDEFDNWDDCYVLVEASKLSFEDDFMQYEPETEQEQTFYKSLCEVIKKGVKDFYRIPMDPTFTKGETGICFEEGKKPAVGKSYNWWVDVAKKFDPEMKSRLGTRNEYIAFLGVLIKLLVKDGWSKKRAWNAVCNDSKELGHYWNSENPKYAFEPTGSRCICGFYDLANTYKILAEDNESGGFWLAGGYYNYDSFGYPLADFYHSIYRDYADIYDFSVGWLVLS